MSAHQVFDAWLNPDQLCQWMFGPNVRDEEIVHLKTIPRVGGSFSFLVRRNGQEIDHVGSYREIVRPARLVFTWGIAGESEDESVVTIEIRTTSTGCELTLTHLISPKWRDYADRTAAGWTMLLGKLTEAIAAPGDGRLQELIFRSHPGMEAPAQASYDKSSIVRESNLQQRVDQAMSEQSVSQPPAASTPVGATPPRKRRILVKLLMLLLLVLGAFLGYVAAQPDDYQVTRSTTVDAPPAQVFAHVNDFHKWEDWSPWAKLDPNAQNTFEGADAGQGAIFKWSGNDDVGEGQMTIQESLPPDRIQIQLEFKRPMEDTSDVEFTFGPEGDRTVVTWTMSGTHKNFVGKVFCTIMNMEKMIGGDFEKGLASMKSTVEADNPATEDQGAETSETE